jgi:hypothetical protein
MSNSQRHGCTCKTAFKTSFKTVCTTTNLSKDNALELALRPAPVTTDPGDHHHLKELAFVWMNRKGNEHPFCMPAMERN